MVKVYLILKQIVVMMTLRLTLLVLLIRMNSISFHSLTKNEDVKYPFLISNTDRVDRRGTHWWSILDIHRKKEIFLFDSYGVFRLQNFLIRDDQKNN